MAVKVTDQARWLLLNLIKLRPLYQGHKTGMGKDDDK
jgi:hypothetical protein